MSSAVINAFVVLHDDESRFTTLRFDSRRVISLDVPPRRGETVIDLAGYAVYPGLVNAHDHIEMNHYPRTKFRPVYTNAAQWAADFTPQLEQEPFRTLRQMPLDEQCRVGGLKNLRSGVTTVAHHNPLHKPLRRADFPMRVVQRYGWAHSFALERRDLRATYRQTPRNAAWMIHLAEGTDEMAANELAQLEALGLLRANTVMIHGVGLSAKDRARAIKVGAGLVWCPSTNLYLLGQTAQVREFAESHLLALGSDSRLTADGDLLDELRAAHAAEQLTPAQLFRAVTSDAARLIRVPQAGTLSPGGLPDFFVTPLTEAIQADPYRALIDLRLSEIRAIWVRGRRSPHPNPSPGGEGLK